jgi:cyclophilin family peptidyl-prolyl cis-trans isomerase/protein-disulfide isomerase
MRHSLGILINVMLVVGVAACTGATPAGQVTPAEATADATPPLVTEAAAAAPTPTPAATATVAATETITATEAASAVAAATATATETAVATAAVTETVATPAATDMATEQSAAATPTTAPYPTRIANPVCEAAPISADDRVPAVTEQDWVKGASDAAVTVIEYADFQCPACAGVGPLLDQLLEARQGNVRLVYRHFPLITIHDKAMITAEASEAAGAQGKFWEMHDLLFERQQQWAAKSPTDMPDVLSGYAGELGLDVTAFKKALTEHTYQAKVKKQYDDSSALGLPGTPSLIFNNIHFPLQQLGLSELAFSWFTDFIEFLDPPPTVIEKDKKYQATIKTDKGDIVLELYADKSPLTVNNFVYLARKGWYDNTIFHRVVPGFVAQGGDRTATGVGRPGYSCQDELDPALAFDGPGVLAMANSGPNTNGSQFFITMDAQPSLNGKHPIFGHVLSGMDVVTSLAARDPQAVPPDAPGDRIISITIQEQ